MNSYSSYPNTPAGFPTGQRGHEQLLSSVQTRLQYSDNRDHFQGNGFQSDPWSQNWPEFPQAPGPMASSQHPGHNALWDGPALGTNESSSTSLQTPVAESVCYNPHPFLTTSKVWKYFESLSIFFRNMKLIPNQFTKGHSRLRMEQ